MRMVWKIHYTSPLLGEEDDAIALTELGASAMDENLRKKGYRVDPHPQQVPLDSLSIIELELCLKHLANLLAEWEIFYPIKSSPHAEELRELGRDLFIEHDNILRELYAYKHASGEDK